MISGAGIITCIGSGCRTCRTAESPHEWPTSPPLRFPMGSNFNSSMKANGKAHHGFAWSDIADMVPMSPRRHVEPELFAGSLTKGNTRAPQTKGKNVRVLQHSPE
jgi:hypothetical protein